MNIDRKITVWTMAVILGIVVISAFVNYHIHMTGEAELFRSLGNTVGPIIEASLENSMMTADAAALHETLRNLGNTEPISRIWIIDRQGTIKAGTDNKAVGVKLHPTDPICRTCHEKGQNGFLLEDKNIFRWVQPVWNKPRCHQCHSPLAKHNGVFVIDFPVAKAQERVKKEIQREFFAFLPSLMLAGLAMLMVSRTLVIRRLGPVIDSVKKFKEGDYGARVPETGDDEITRLSEGINEIACSTAASEDELKRHAEELLALAVSSNVVSAVPETENIHEAVCHIAVRELKLKMAWIGLLKKGGYEVEPVAQYGFEKGSVSSVRTTWDDSPAGMGPTGMAIKTKTPRMVNDMDSEPAYAPWRDEAAKRGCRSSMALPLLSSDGEALGVLNLYSGEPGYFTRKRIRVFMIFANQAAAAIENRSLIEHLEEKNRKIAQQLKVISRSQKEWQTTFDSIRDLISIHDKDFRIIKANRAFFEFVGLEPAEAIHRKCYELMHGTCGPVTGCPHVTSLRENAAATEEIVDPKTGGIFRVSTFPYYSPEGEFVGSVHIAKDVTEIREKELRLIMSERLAALGQMASGLAHEINNPLASIAGCAEGLLMKVKTDRYDPALFTEYLTIIEEEIQRCKSITTGMLSFVRKTAYEKKQLNINVALDKTLEIIGFQGRLDEVEIIRNYKQDLPVVQGSEGELRQVFLTVITNALDAMEDSGTLTLETAAEGDRALIKISDTGPGILPDNINRIFDPFFTTKSEIGGTGLGLSIAHKIITNHGGSIDVTSEKGNGTTFVISIPIH